MNALVKPLGIFVMSAGLMASHAHAQGFLKISSHLSTLPASAKSASAKNLANSPRPVSALTPIAPAGAAAMVQADGDSARGVIRAAGEAMLSSRLAARIIKMPLKEGDAFKKGDVLVEFDCERQAAESRAAKAQMQIQAKTVDTNEELDRFSSIGKNDLAISKSQYDKARAELDALNAQLKDCKIIAPFQGRVVERVARNHEAVSVSQPLLRVADTTQLELDMIVPSAWLQWLDEGTRFEFKVDETGQTVKGQVDRINAAVDPVSKTIKIVGRFKPTRGQVLPGMSGSARFAQARS
jgi:RND family efflux transporter MFP subunit